MTALQTIDAKIGAPAVEMPAEQRRLAVAQAPAERFIQYGCGAVAAAGWLNFDASPRLRLERFPGVTVAMRFVRAGLFAPAVRIGDIVAGLPVPDNFALAVYCSHVLEHLPRDSVPAALANTFRILASGGVFRLVVPDLDWRVEKYLTARERQDPGAADHLLDSLLLGTRVKPRGIAQTIRRAFGHSAHLWMYDFPALSKLLAEAGFARIRRCQFGDSTIREFSAVEDRSRFFEGEHHELAIEAIKP